MPKFLVGMHDYVRIDATVCVEAENAGEARLKAVELWNEDDASVSTENGWSDGVEVDSVEEVEE